MVLLVLAGKLMKKTWSKNGFRRFRTFVLRVTIVLLQTVQECAKIIVELYCAELQQQHHLCYPIIWCHVCYVGHVKHVKAQIVQSLYSV